MSKTRLQWVGCGNGPMFPVSRSVRTCLIHRSSELNYERAVFTQLWPGYHRIINPEVKVRFAVGSESYLNRSGCVVGMAAGIQAGGYQVHVRTYSRPSTFTDRVFQGSAYTVVPEYFLFGLAWAKGLWGQVCSDLGVILPEKRLTVLQESGRYYLTYPQEALASTRIDLLVSLGQLIHRYKLSV